MSYFPELLLSTRAEDGISKRMDTDIPLVSERVIIQPLGMQKILQVNFRCYIPVLAIA